MFKRKEPKSLPVVKGFEAGKSFYHPIITEIWKTTSLPRSEYDKTYLPLFKNAFDCLSAPPAGGWASGTADYEKLLKYLFGLARVRSSYILPKGSPAEEITKNGEVFTFALLSAVLIDYLGLAVSSIVPPREVLEQNPYLTGGFDPKLEQQGFKSPVKGAGLLLSSVIIPKKGFDWLYQSPTAFPEWLLFFTKPSESILFEISRRVSIERPNPIIESVHNDSVEDLAVVEKIAGMEKTVPVKTEEVEVAPVVKPAVPKGWLFVASVKEGIKNSLLTVSKKDSFIHVDAASNTFLQVPEIFEWYESVSGVAANTAKNQFTRLGVHSIKEDKKNFYKAELKDEKIKLNGLVVENEDIFFIDGAAQQQGSIVVDYK